MQPKKKKRCLVGKTQGIKRERHYERLVRTCFRHLSFSDKLEEFPVSESWWPHSSWNISLKKVFKQTINVIMSTMDKELVEVVPGIVPVRPVVTATWLALEAGLRPTSSVQKRRKTASCGQYQGTDAGRQKTQPDLTAQTAHWISANRDTFSPGSTETTVTETSLRLQQISAHLLGLIKRFKVFWGVNTLLKMSE